MSLDLMSWAFKQDIEPPAKLVLLALADHANGQTGLCIPGQKALADQCSMSVRTVQRHLNTLESSGLIRREARMRGEGRGRTSDRYWLRDQGDSSGPTRQTVTTNTTHQDDQHDTAVVAEPEGNRKGTDSLAAAPRGTVKPKAPRPPDHLFDTMVTVCGINPATLTGSERGRINKALKELREVGATPQDIEARAKAYRTKYPDAAITPTALTGNWSALQTARQANPVCPDCRQRLNQHDDEICTIISNGGI